MDPDEHRYCVTLHRRFVFHFGPIHFHVSFVYETEREYLFIDFLLSQYYVSLSMDSIRDHCKRHTDYCAKQCGDLLTITVGCLHNVQSGYRDT